MPLPLLIGLGAAGLGLAGKGINYFSAKKDQEAAERALAAEQAIPYAQYSATGQLNRYYGDALNNTLNPQGLTAGEKSVFQDNLSRTDNTIASNATRGSGGSLNRYIIGALNPSVISANNQLVAQDASIKRANQLSAYGRLGSAVNAYQGIQDRNIAGEIQRKMMREQYLGQSALQNKAFQSNTLDSIGSDLIGGGLLLGLGGYGGSASGGGGTDTSFMRGMDANIAGNKYLKINTGLKYGAPR
jgi:hypothetical protein